MNYFNGKSVLVTGGTGMIGQALVPLLQEMGANIRVVSLDDPSRAPEGVEFVQADLREFSNCLDVCIDMDVVFHLAGVKGSPAMTATRPASFFVPTLTFSLNMMEAARRNRVQRYMFTSSVGVYSPAETFNEDDVWQTMPSPNDRFAGWAKRMCELQAEAYAIEYGWDEISVVRPANVYGPFDNFDPENAMVIPSLIRKAFECNGELEVWGDGSPIRDFIHARDVAYGMIFAVENSLSKPINLGSGHGHSIREIVELIVAEFGGAIKINWDLTKPSGDRKRIMNMERAFSLGYKPKVSIEEGIRDTVEWYCNNKAVAANRYNPFTETALAAK